MRVYGILGLQSDVQGQGCDPQHAETLRGYPPCVLQANERGRERERERLLPFDKY